MHKLYITDSPAGFGFAPVTVREEKPVPAGRESTVKAPWKFTLPEDGAAVLRATVDDATLALILAATTADERTAALAKVTTTDHSSAVTPTVGQLSAYIASLTARAAEAESDFRQVMSSDLQSGILYLSASDRGSTAKVKATRAERTVAAIDALWSAVAPAAESTATDDASDDAPSPEPEAKRSR